MDAIEIVKKHLDSYGAGRWDDYKADLSSDVVYEETATLTRTKGIEGYLATVQRWKQAYPDLKATVREAFASGDRVFAELEWAGTHQGTLETPFGAIPATGKSGTVRAALVVRLRDDKIVESHHYFDNLTVLMQIGAVPGMAARAPAQPEAAAPPPHS